MKGFVDPVLCIPIEVRISSVDTVLSVEFWWYPFDKFCGCATSYELFFIVTRFSVTWGIRSPTRIDPKSFVAVFFRIVVVTQILQSYTDIV